MLFHVLLPTSLARLLILNVHYRNLVRCAEQLLGIFGGVGIFHGAWKGIYSQD